MLLYYNMGRRLIPILLLLIAWNVRAYELEAVYWELKPYIFINNYNMLDGVVPMIFRRAQYYCYNQSLYTQFSNEIYLKKTGNRLDYKHEEQSQKTFINLALSDLKYGSGILSNISFYKAFWFPYILDSMAMNTQLFDKRSLRTFELSKSLGVAVIMPRKRIELLQKFLVALRNCYILFLLTLLLSIIFAMTVWLVEHYSTVLTLEEPFLSSSLELWWSMVTLASVGYGDKVPASTTGRVIAIAWMFIALTLLCVTTATVLSSVKGTSSLSIYKERVAVIRLSYEATIAEKDYQADRIYGDTYEEVLNHVKAGKADAALINMDVASYMQDYIREDKRPLHIVYTIEKEVSVNVLTNLENPSTFDLFSCMLEHQVQVLEKPREYFRRPCRTETLYYSSADEVFTNRFVLVFIGSGMALLFLLVLLIEILKYKRWIIYKEPKTNMKCYTHTKNNIKSNVFIIDKKLTINENLSELMKSFTFELLFMQKEVRNLQQEIEEIQRKITHKRKQGQYINNIQSRNNHIQILTECKIVTTAF